MNGEVKIRVQEKKINAKKMKEHNMSLILNTLRRNESTTRRELARETGLTAGAITIIINELQEMGYIVEKGIGFSAGGRRPTILSLKPDAAYAIGVELTTQQITCVLGDFTAAIQKHAAIPIDVAWGYKRIIDLMAHAIDKLILASGISKDKIQGIGLAIPGPSDYKQGITINPPNFPDWVNVHIKEILEHRTGLKVYASKETSCAALAEYWFGSALGTKRIFAIHIDEIGIGGAFVLDGDIYQSSAKETMNIGHTIVKTDGQSCACGSKGCLEAQASGAAAIRYALEYARQHPDCATKVYAGMSFLDLAAGVARGDLPCIEAVEKCSYYISVALRNIIMLLAPEKIYYVGGFVDRCPMLMDKVIEYIDRQQYPDSSRVIPIMPCKFGKESGAVGALALVFSMLFED
ncbi:MAG: ROK family transcriptional regulator [Christensenellaceae bacterium]|nr:ROK family transcriptional regulator [Christensenellaceae bacterium]MEA5069679.1 ROK family transcriptional regulator [Christensenellaceae bacterium]